jgi:hypothetical protein
MIAASAVYFSYIVLVTLLLRPVTGRGRRGVLAAAGGGLLLTLITASTTIFWLRGVVLPPALLLAAYWSSGLMWRGPMPRIERALAGVDRRLGVLPLAARMPRAACEFLELAYVGVYPLIPIALFLHLSSTPSPDADRFWTVILVTDYVCFGMLPWVQTRPPRRLEAPAPWGARLRSFNVNLLKETSIGVNTVPSGHAAEAVAAALLVSGAPWPLTAAMWGAAVAVSAGAVLGRYHFAVDAISGWLVAVLVWTLFAGQ